MTSMVTIANNTEIGSENGSYTFPAPRTHTHIQGNYVS